MLFTAPLDRLEGLCYFAAARGDRQVLALSSGTRARDALLGLALPAAARPVAAEAFVGLTHALAVAFPDLGRAPRGDGASASAGRAPPRPERARTLSPEVPAPSGAPPGSVYFGPAAERWSLLGLLFPGHSGFVVALELPLDARGLWFPTRHSSPLGGRVTREEHLYVAAPLGRWPGAEPPRAHAAFQRGLPHPPLGAALGEDHVLWSMTLAGPRPDEDTWVQLA
jgi:hypothetical protein